MSKKNKRSKPEGQRNIGKPATAKYIPAEDIAKHQNGSDYLEPSYGILYSCLTGILLFFLYVRTLHPSVAGGDSGELIVSASEVGVAHPPGYPLFTMLAKLSMIVIPFGSPAWRVNLLNAFFSALAGSTLQMATFKLTQCLASSLFAVGLFSLSKLTWTWSVGAEVFSLNNFFVALLMLNVIILEQKNEDKDILKMVYCGAFISGLSLCNQHTIAIYIFTIILWTIKKLITFDLLSISVCLHTGFYFTLGLLPYVYLPIASVLNIARWTWGDQRSIQGFIKHLLRFEYGTFDLGKEQSGLGFTQGLVACLAHSQKNLCFLGPILTMIATVFLIYKKQSVIRSSSLLFYAMLVIYILFFSWRANLDITNPLLKGVTDRFWMQSDIVISFLAGVGYYVISNQLIEMLINKQQSSLKLFLKYLGLSAMIVLQLKNYTSCDHSQNYVIKDFAQILINRFPQNAIIFTKGDLPTNSLRYFHLVENVRPDLQIIDVEIMTYEWFFPMLRKHYPKIIFPGDFWHLQNGNWPNGRRSFNFQNLLDNNYQKYPLFSCIGMQERDSSWENSYTQWPYGVCSKIEAKTKPFDPVYWTNITASFADAWLYSFKSFDLTSWEKVANDEMWHAKVHSAFFMYSQAELITNPVEKTQLFLKSFELYKYAIKKVSQSSIPDKLFPSFWHKNFALVCEKLLYQDHHISELKLCKKAIYHFQKYVDLERDDKDLDKIRDIINVLKQRLDYYKNINKLAKL